MSNIYFEAISISEDVAPNSSIELVLTLPREDRNCGAGNMFDLSSTVIQRYRL